MVEFGVILIVHFLLQYTVCIPVVFINFSNDGRAFGHVYFTAVKSFKLLSRINDEYTVMYNSNNNIFHIINFILLAIQLVDCTFFFNKSAFW